MKDRKQKGKPSYAWVDVFEAHQYYEFEEPKVHDWIKAAQKIIWDITQEAKRCGVIEIGKAVEQVAREIWTRDPNSPSEAMRSWISETMGAIIYNITQEAKRCDVIGKGNEEEQVMKEILARNTDNPDDAIWSWIDEMHEAIARSKYSANPWMQQTQKGMEEMLQKCKSDGLIGQDEDVKQVAGEIWTRHLYDPRVALQSWIVWWTQSLANHISEEAKRRGVIKKDKPFSQIMTEILDRDPENALDALRSWSNEMQRAMGKSKYEVGVSTQTKAKKVMRKRHRS